MTKFIVMIVALLVTPKVGAMHELLFNKLASGATKFLSLNVKNLVTLCCSVLTVIKLNGQTLSK